MSDYNNPNDPSRRDSSYDLNARSRNAASGWIAGGVFLVIIIGLAFGVGHMPNHGKNDSTAVNGSPPPATQPAPSGPATRTYSPAPSPTPMSPMPNPAQTQAPAQP
jgi:hypothetical protein